MTADGSADTASSYRLAFIVLYDSNLEPDAPNHPQPRSFFLRSRRHRVAAAGDPGLVVSDASARQRSAGCGADGALSGEPLVLRGDGDGGIGAGRFLRA